MTALARLATMVSYRQDYRWLAPAAANLATLKVRIPPGFRRVRAAGQPATR